jgi:HlyD family secretion protein
MRKLMSKKARRWTILGAVVVVIGGFLGYRYWKSQQNAVPKGIAWGNGRLEAQLVDTTTKEPLRVKQVLVSEGDLVKPGQVLVKMDTITLEASLAEANAKLAGAKEKLAAENAAIVRVQSQIELATIEEDRTRKLAAERAGAVREHDVRVMALKTSRATLAEEQAKLKVAQEEAAAAEASVAEVQSRINDATLTSPILGRVLYKLAEPGEVLGAGGKALTLVNLEDVYMEIFLPSEQAAAVKLGSEARFTIDVERSRVGVGYVSFVSPEAQFTPKEVETRSEREKLMFRVKVQVPREMVLQYIEALKTGIRGVGYVQTNPSVHWPDWLNKNLVRPEHPERRNVSGRTTPDGSPQEP